MKILGKKSSLSALSVVVLSAAMFLCGLAQATQYQGQYKTAYRTSPAGLQLGVIQPDADGDYRNYLAQRFVYGDSSRPTLVTRIESGNLVFWLDDTIKPVQWTNFEVFSTRAFEYDNYGRKTKEWIEGKNGTIEMLSQYTYTARGLVQCKARRMNKSAYSSLPTDACVQSTLGAEGPDRITRYTYNDLDQVLTEERGVETSLLQVYVTNTYDGYLLKTQTDANGNKTALEYDEFGRLTYRYYPSKTTPGTASTTDYTQYTYDANNNIRTERKRDGSLITYTYDKNNRLTIKDLSNNTYAQDTYYNYDLRGLTLHTRYGSDSGQGIINQFDGFGLVLKSTTTMGGVSRVLAYEYDKNGNRTRITHPDNTYFTYTFDGLNRVNGVSESANSSLLTLDYWENGSRKAINRTGGAITSYGRDNANRLGSFTQDFGGTSNDLTNTFSYNPASQVTQLTQSNNRYSYVGDANKKGAYVPNGLNQYISINGFTVSYDNNGNLTKDLSDSGQAYTYDMENRLVNTTTGVSSSFIYDPLGRLFQTTIDNVVTRFLYDGDALVAEYNSSNGLTRRYVHGDQVDEPWVEYGSSSIGVGYRTYLHADHQGSIIAKTDGFGNYLGKLTYDSFGIPDTANSGRFGYTGQIWLKELGLFYYKARVYSPKQGRFLQTDPIFYADQMNMYAYVGNDPINMTDPTGMYGYWPGMDEMVQTAEANGQAEVVRTVMTTALTSAIGGGVGGNVAVKVVSGLSNGAKGKIGEAVARAGIALRGEKVIAAQEKAGSVINGVSGRGAKAVPDYVVKDAKGNVKVVEAKFGSSNLTGAQKDLQKQMGDSFTVSRTTYNDVANAGAAAGAATGAAASCVATASSPCR